MPFLARIEIQNPDLPTYYRLHAAMEAESFSRVVTGANDFKQYKMPLGTYWTDAFDDSWAAFNAAQRATLAIDANAQIVLCGTGPLLFHNCKQCVDLQFAGLNGLLQSEIHRTTPNPAPAPAPVANGKHSLAGLRSLFENEPCRTPPPHPHVPHVEHPVAGLDSFWQTDPYGSLPRLAGVPAAAMKGSGSR
jgi:hypothetical protein